MNIHDYAKIILEGENLSDKLIPIKEISDFKFKNSYRNYQLKKQPSRSKKLRISEERLKFPKVGALHLPEKRAIALHFFANHELLAIEMMAGFILKFQENSLKLDKMKLSILSALSDEQKHFGFYSNRLNSLGIEFGDYPLNDFFWKQFDEIKTPEQFFALMSLTFESANLDFCLYYKEIFLKVGDTETANVLEKVYQDEIRHVRMGYNWLKPLGGSVWENYKSLLPEKITPSRAKGVKFFEESRIKAGLDEDFIQNLKSYNDSYNITSRKSWTLLK